MIRILFFNTLILSDTKTGSTTLHKNYISFVRAKAPRNIGAISIALKSRGFFRQLKAFLKEKFGLKQDNKNKFRGYFVEVPRSMRVQVALPIQRKPNNELKEIIKGKVYEIGLLKIMWVNKECGFSAFAARTILEGEFVVEYLGKELTMDEGKRLNEYYVDELKLPSTMLWSVPEIEVPLTV